MPDDTTKRSPKESARVNVHERCEVDYAPREWDVSHAELKAAVAKVGVSVAAVSSELGQSDR